MAPLRPNTRKTIKPVSTVLIDLVRLLARQAARELTERQPEIDDAAPPDPRSEKQS
jgi:hypothetical protein